MKNKTKTYTIFAGVNGAGKSTLYRQINADDLGVRINADEILKIEPRTLVNSFMS